MGDYLQTKWFLHNGMNYEVGNQTEALIDWSLTLSCVAVNVMIVVFVFYLAIAMLCNLSSTEIQPVC
jgi:hypothetical protein